MPSPAARGKTSPTTAPPDPVLERSTETVAALLLGAAALAVGAAAAVVAPVPTAAWMTPRAGGRGPATSGADPVPATVRAAARADDAAAGRDRARRDITVIPHPGHDRLLDHTH